MSGDRQFAWDMLESEWWKQYFGTADRGQPGSSAVYGSAGFGSWTVSRMDSSVGFLSGSWAETWGDSSGGFISGSWGGSWNASSFSTEEWSSAMAEQWWDSSYGSWWMNIPEEWWTSWNGSWPGSFSSSADCIIGPGYGLQLI